VTSIARNGITSFGLGRPLSGGPPLVWLMGTIVEGVR
jgi:hypothetical protein